MPVINCRILAALLACAVISGATQASDSPKASQARLDDWRERLNAFSRDNFKHPAWGYGHSLRVYELAKLLAQADKSTLDDDVLFATAMVHDIAAFSQWSKADQDHADRAADILTPMLLEAGFPEAKIRPVLEAVRTHMYDRKPVGLEAMYFHDADGLDWLGAIGAFRLSAIVETGGAQPDGPAAMGLLQQRLSEVPKGIVTPAGKRELRKRERSLQKFLDELQKQSNKFQQL